MLATAIGQMGLGLETFLDLTPFEFQCVHRRFIEKIEKDREAELYQKLLVARLQLFKQLCPPKGKQIKITDLWELPGEAEDIAAKRRKVIENKERDRERMRRKFGG